MQEQNLKENPLLDLELLRRRLEIWPIDRSIPEVWLLAGRHPESEEIYEWGAWYFDRQKYYAETAQLLKIAAQQKISAEWMNVCQALAMLREGRIDEGYKILETNYRNMPYREKNSVDWRVPANMARVMEGRSSATAALNLYQAAAGLAANPADLSQIQLRLSRCYEALGRFDESRKALEIAAELDPENLSVRLETGRLGRLGR